MRSSLGQMLGVMVLVISAFSGYFVAISPQSSTFPQWMPGALVFALSLALIVGIEWVRSALDDDTALGWGGLVSLLVFVFVVPIYVSAFLALTIEAPVPGRVFGGEARQVVGSSFTAESAGLVFRLGRDVATDEKLVEELGGVDQVWTEQSILENGRVLALWYLLTFVSGVCAVYFLGTFADRAMELGAHVRERPGELRRKRARARRKRKRQPTEFYGEARREAPGDEG